MHMLIFQHRDDQRLNKQSFVDCLGQLAEMEWTKQINRKQIKIDMLRFWLFLRKGVEKSLNITDINFIYFSLCLFFLPVLGNTALEYILFQVIINMFTLSLHKQATEQVWLCSGMWDPVFLSPCFIIWDTETRIFFFDPQKEKVKGFAEILSGINFSLQNTADLTL